MAGIRDDDDGIGMQVGNPIPTPNCDTEGQRHHLQPDADSLTQA